MKKNNSIAPQIIAILDEIERLNQAITLHQSNDYGAVMIEQYERVKKQYITDLEQIMLNRYQISFYKAAA